MLGAPNGLTTRREIFCPKRSKVCTGEGQYQSRELVAEDFVSQLSTRLVSHPTATKMVTSWGSKLRPKLTTVFKHCSHVFRLDTSDMPTRKNWCSSTAVSMKNVVLRRCTHPFPVSPTLWGFRFLCETKNSQYQGTAQNCWRIKANLLEAAQLSKHSETAYLNCPWANQIQTKSNAGLSKFSMAGGHQLFVS